MPFGKSFHFYAIWELCHLGSYQKKYGWTRAQILKGPSKHYAKKGIKTITTVSEKRSAFAARNIRSLKNLISNYLEDEWTN